MLNKKLALSLSSFAIAATLTLSGAASDQAALKPVVNKGEKFLSYDWPILKIGTAEYSEGPTGVTVFHFDKKVYSAIDVRGGGPGTVNAPYMQLGYDMPELDTVVLSGGSWYGLEAVTAVASALKDDDIRDGGAFTNPPNIAMSVGSIIFDFGGRRLNEIYPDKKLAQAAFRAAEHGKFPLGAEGAGRFAVTGGYVGCNAKSGQGAAFRQIGDLKIMAFTVVNALGMVTDRDGSLVACYKGESWPTNLKTSEVLQAFPDSKRSDWSGVGASEGKKRENTTVSLVVVNQKMEVAELERLAMQVHTSMGRALQPFASIYDGDVLYAVSTAELETPELPAIDVGTIASEVMWDAVLASVPEQPKADTPAENLKIKASKLKSYVGNYTFSQFVSVNVTEKDGALYAQASGTRPAYAIGVEEAVPLVPVSENSFMVPGRYPLTLSFAQKGELVLNPGHWQQVGKR
ncbi:P1 family peptidase [Kordiimonas pumila]|uniref:P1 family peptidase n=1 Tax=Kordiimonas pumila TaxID=2161677 RepID=A0ABV7D950_9PROT|nr:P1 family peptidase [Kordiimonas pumila]